MDVRLQVDWLKCDGYGLCGDLLPDLIELDDWSYPILRPGTVDPTRLNDLQRAADCCPTKALLLRKDRPERRK